MPQPGIEPGPSGDRPTLYHVAINAGLYRKAVQVYHISITTTYSPSILRFVRESQFEQPLNTRPPSLLGYQAHQMGLFRLGEKSLMPRPGIEPDPLDLKSYTLPRRYKSRLVLQGSTSVSYTYYTHIPITTYHHMFRTLIQTKAYMPYLTLWENRTEFWPFLTPFPIRFSNLTEFSYHLISFYLKN